MTIPDIPAPGGTIALLDGGVGQELYRRRRRPSAPLWSVQVMIDDPDLVETVHLEFIEAGARIITLNSYSATPHRLANAGRAEMFEAVHDAALRAAQAARDRSGREVRIAGCLPPLTASYRPDLTPPEDVCLADYRRVVAAQAAGVDLFLCETLSTVREARLATLAARESGRTVWTALTVDDADGGRRRRDRAAVRRAGCRSAPMPTGSCRWSRSGRAGLSTCWTRTTISIRRPTPNTRSAGRRRAPRFSAAAAKSGRPTSRSLRGNSASKVTA